MCYRRTAAVRLRSDLPKPTRASAGAGAGAVPLSHPDSAYTYINTDVHGKGTAEGIIKVPAGAVAGGVRSFGDGQ
jgi:hypothetical protein